MSVVSLTLVVTLSGMLSEAEGSGLGDLRRSGGGTTKEMECQGGGKIFGRRSEEMRWCLEDALYSVGEKIIEALSRFGVSLSIQGIEVSSTAELSGNMASEMNRVGKCRERLFFSATESSLFILKSLWYQYTAIFLPPLPTNHCERIDLRRHFCCRIFRVLKWKIKIPNTMNTSILLIILQVHIQHCLCQWQQIETKLFTLPWLALPRIIIIKNWRKKSVIEKNFTAQTSKFYFCLPLKFIL